MLNLGNMLPVSSWQVHILSSCQWLRLGPSDPGDAARDLHKIAGASSGTWTSAAPPLIDSTGTGGAVGERSRR